MNIEVKYKDDKNSIYHQNHYLSKLAFAKHVICVGKATLSWDVTVFVRSLATLIYYSDYVKSADFYNSKFSLPPIELSDPTEKGQFSNIAGRAIADFLSKKISGSIFTWNYEAAMRSLDIGIVGPRPDLLAFTDSKIFSIEAKGYTDGPRNMDEHKKQAASGQIIVDFSVASVSYSLYSQVRCNYYDPIQNKTPDFKEALTKVSKDYYSGFLDFLDLGVSKFAFKNENYYEIELSLGSTFVELYLNDTKPKSKSSYKLSLLLPVQIRKYAENGIFEELKSFDIDNIIMPNEQNEKEDYNDEIFIDKDGIGLRVTKKIEERKK
ncbi:hypothetical protein [Myroides odoratimimus]|uniref:hypothetical protein n=1 Tax=Myroides odoratimimus TaxID=76832 RepID=UPI0031011EB9